MVAEIRRVAAKGCTAVTMPELPHLDGLPSYHDLSYWGPVFQTLSDEQVVMCLHIGQGFAAIKGAPDGPIDNLIILATQVSAFAAQDLLWGPAFRTYPDLKVAWSEAGIGWVAFYLDRCDRHYTNQIWLHRDFGGKLPSEVFRDHSLACYVSDPTALKVRRDIGIDIIAWECDYPHSDSIWPEAPEVVMSEMEGADGARRRDRQDHVAEQRSSLPLRPVRAHPTRAGHGRRAPCPRHRRRHHGPVTDRVGRTFRGGERGLTATTRWVLSRVPLPCTDPREE